MNEKSYFDKYYYFISVLWPKWYFSHRNSHLRTNFPLFDRVLFQVLKVLEEMQIGQVCLDHPRSALR